MDTRLSPEQISLRDATTAIVDRFGPKTVQALDDVERRGGLEAAGTGSGWYELRTADASGQPWASAVEAAIVAEELGHGLADIAFLGPTLAAELRRLAGTPAAPSLETVGLVADLSGLAVQSDGHVPTSAIGIDGRGAHAVLVLSPLGGGFELVSGEAGPTMPEPVDLTRPSVSIKSGSAVGVVPGQNQALRDEDLARWTALALALCSADLVGAMRGAVTLACEYARSRRQYGAAIGSFQAIQHLLADAHVLTEGSRSTALHAAWAVDALEADEALVAASVAKAYCARAARTVCETAIQVHGGIGNTWECLAHLYLRRSLHSSDLLGGVGACLTRIQGHHGIGGSHGLP
jgi:alkylation response protein AidB-like acyl-CoA dehydrogenase